MANKSRLDQSMSSGRTMSQENVVTIRDKHYGAVKLSMYNGDVKGRVLAEDIATLGVGVTLTYSDRIGNQYNGYVTADKTGRFIDESRQPIADYSVTAQTQLRTPEGNRLNVQSKLIKAESYNDNCLKTEDAFSYLITENSECFVSEL